MKNNKKGFSLIMAASILFILSIAIISYLRISGNQYRFYVHEYRSMRAIGLADAGIEYGRYKIEQEQTTPGGFTLGTLFPYPNPPFGYPITITISDSDPANPATPPPYEVRSTISVEDVRILTIAHQVDGSGHLVAGSDNSYTIEVQ